MTSTCPLRHEVASPRIHLAWVFLVWVFLGWAISIPVVVLSGCKSEKKQVQEVREVPKSVDGDSDYRSAQIEFKKQNYEKANELLDSALSKKLKLYTRSTVLQLQGQCFRQLGQLSKAVDAYTKAAEADPENHEALIFRGVVYRLQKKYELANQSYQAALKIKPDSATLHISIGVLAIFRKQFEEAVSHLKLAIEFDPTNPVAHSNLALAYANLFQFDNAQSSLKTANLLGYKKVAVVQAKIDRLKLASIKIGSASAGKGPAIKGPAIKGPANIGPARKGPANNKAPAK